MYDKYDGTYSSNGVKMLVYSARPKSLVNSFHTQTDHEKKKINKKMKGGRKLHTLMPLKDPVNNSAGLSLLCDNS
jgi:hypothetical protein